MYDDIGVTFRNLANGMNIFPVDDGRDERICPSDQSVDAWIVLRGIAIVRSVSQRYRKHRSKHSMRLTRLETSKDNYQGTEGTCFI